MQNRTASVFDCAITAAGHRAERGRMLVFAEGVTESVTPVRGRPCVQPYHHVRVEQELSHSETLSGLTVRQRRTDVSKRAHFLAVQPDEGRRNGIDKFGREWTVPMWKLIRFGYGENL